MVVLSALKLEVPPHRTLAPRPAPPLTANSARRRQRRQRRRQRRHRRSHRRTKTRRHRRRQAKTGEDTRRHRRRHEDTDEDTKCLSQPATSATSAKTPAADDVTSGASGLKDAHSLHSSLAQASRRCAHALKLLECVVGTSQRLPFCSASQDSALVVHCEHAA